MSIRTCSQNHLVRNVQLTKWVPSPRLTGVCPSFLHFSLQCLGLHGVSCWFPLLKTLLFLGQLYWHVLFSLFQTFRAMAITRLDKIHVEFSHRHNLISRNTHSSFNAVFPSSPQQCSSLLCFLHIIYFFDAFLNVFKSLSFCSILDQRVILSIPILCLKKIIQKKEVLDACTCQHIQLSRNRPRVFGLAHKQGCLLLYTSASSSPLSKLSLHSQLRWR